MSPSSPSAKRAAEIERQRCSHFDPLLVDAFLPLAPELHREWFEPSPASPRAA